MTFQTSEVNRPLGVNIDQNPYEVPPEVWTFVINGDSVDGKFAAEHLLELNDISLTRRMQPTSNTPLEFRNHGCLLLR